MSIQTLVLQFQLIPFLGNVHHIYNLTGKPNPHCYKKDDFIFFNSNKHVNMCRHDLHLFLSSEAGPKRHEALQCVFAW